MKEYDGTAPSNQRACKTFIRLFEALIVFDLVLFALHVVLLVRTWKDDDRDGLLDLSLATSHFLANTIAISDIYVHLRRFDRDDECAFEAAKSTNAFLFSVIGAYVDLATLSASDPTSYIRVFGWGLFSESVICAVVSVACFAWGRGTIAVCDVEAKIKKAETDTPEPEAFVGSMPRHRLRLS